jgi:hypothetical protein
VVQERPTITTLAVTLSFHVDDNSVLYFYLT